MVTRSCAGALCLRRRVPFSRSTTRRAQATKANPHSVYRIRSDVIPDRNCRVPPSVCRPNLARRWPLRRESAAVKHCSP
jgi:hypothetical protein